MAVDGECRREHQVRDNHLPETAVKVNPLNLITEGGISDKITGLFNLLPTESGAREV